MSKSPFPNAGIRRVLIGVALTVFAWLAWSLFPDPIERSAVACVPSSIPPPAVPTAQVVVTTGTGVNPAGLWQTPCNTQEGGIQKTPSPARAAVHAGDQSLEDALEAARHAVHPILDSERILEENRDARFFAHNPEQAMVARFYDGPVKMQSSQPGSLWRLEVWRPGPKPVVSSGGRRVEYRHADGVIEWYENQTAGLQHGLIVPSQTAGVDVGMLRMRMAVRGLSAADDPSSPGDLCFTDDEGRALAAYRGLKAWDARGRELPAEMRTISGGFEIAVNDSNALYPVRIDPYFLNLEQSIRTEMAGSANSDERFGTATALDGETAVVTARFAPTMTTTCGRAYVFVREGSLWSLQAELWPDDGTSGDDFGHSVDLDGDTLVIGAWKANVHSPSYRDDAGRVYVFQRNGETWTQQANLTAPSPQSSSLFGNSVSLQGDELLIGSYSGGAYWFRKSAGAWQFQSQPQPSTGALAYGFGDSVALAGDSMVIGAPREALGVAAQVGAAYFFTRSGGTWVQTQRIASPYTATESRFASRVALDGDTAIIGSPEAKSGTKTGVVDIYRKDGGGTWTPEVINLQNANYLNAGVGVAVSGDLALIGSSTSTVLIQRTGSVWDRMQTFNYGPAVAIEGTTILLGAFGDRGDGTAHTAYNGAAFMHEFDGTSWALRQRLTMGNSRGGTGLGNAVALQGDTMLVGASNEPTAIGALVGAAYVFTRSGGLWQQQARLVSDLPAPLRYFGSTLALDGDTAAIGCSRDTHVSSTGVETSNVGSVILFVRTGTTWSQQQKVHAGDFASSDGFSTGLALLGNQLLAGSPNDSDGTASGQVAIGSTYWFERSGSTWTQKSKFRSGVSRDNQRFGCSIAIDGTSAVIGAYSLVETVSGLGYYAGQAFVFTFSGTAWSKQAALQSPAPGPGILFGNSVAISGNTAIIGAPGFDLPSVSDPFGTKGGVGRCYVFTRTGTAWSVQATLDPLNGEQQTAFGKTMRIKGDVAVIGLTGGVDLFTRSGTTWTRQGTFHSIADPAETSFGSALALDGDLLAVGSSGMNKELDSIQRTYDGFGAVEIFRITTSSPGVIITNPAATSVTLPDTTQSLRFTAAIDIHGAAGTPAITWSKLSGPGTVNFSNSTATDTYATFSSAGTYVIQCAVTIAGNITTRTRMVAVGTPSVMTFRQGENAYRQDATTLRSDNPTWNAGSSNQLLAGRNTSGLFRSVLSFDLRGMPANAIVQDVALELTTSSEAGSGSVSPLELRWLSTPFTEGTGSGLSSSPLPNTDSGATWQRRTNVTDNLAWSLYYPNIAGGDLLSSVPGFNAQTETGAQKTFASTPDFLRITQQAVISDRLNLVIRAATTESGTGDNFTRIHSDDAPDIGVRPRLRITYISDSVPLIASGPLTAQAAKATSLQGLVTSATTARWSTLSGPGSASFSDPVSLSTTVTFDQPGTYVLSVTAANGSGEASRTINVEVQAALPDPSIFADWQQLTWPGETNPAIISPDEDPDGDGLNNLLEWALHLDARTNKTAEVSLALQNGVIEYRYTRRQIDAGEGNFQIEWSESLGTDWNSADVSRETITPLTETSESVLVTIPAGTNGQRFVRLRFTRP